MNTILVIEDNDAIGDNMVELLEILGFCTWLAATGQLGISLAQEKKPDLILCDIQLPGLDGYEVLRTLQLTENFAQVPFYFMSAKAEQTDQQLGMNLGAMGYLTKPFSEADLLNCIFRHLAVPTLRPVQTAE